MILIKLALTVWIYTHTIATEIPITANSRKPFNCQLCLSGWICLASSIVSLVIREYNLTLEILGAWGLSVLIEAIYCRLTTVII